MTASRSQCHATDVGLDTACPPRRPFVAGDVRHRGQACTAQDPASSAFGAQRFSVIVDD